MVVLILIHILNIFNKGIFKVYCTHRVTHKEWDFKDEIKLFLMMFYKVEIGFEPKKSFAKWKKERKPEM